jgi:hypothetical protein
MKNRLICLLAVILFASCSKEKQSRIVGAWLEDAVYEQNQTGGFAWRPASRFPLLLTFWQDGKYASATDVGSDHGNFMYNPSKREITFESASFGTLSVQTVSLLNENSLIIDYADNSILHMRMKFRRYQ